MKHVTAFLERTPVATVVSYALAGLGALAAVLVLGDEIGRHIDGFESWVDGLGPWAIVAFVPLYALLGSVLVPDTLLGIVAGASFGFTRGLIAVALGSVLAAASQYGLARGLLKPLIVRAMSRRPALTAVQEAVVQQELKLQLLIRLTPVNRAVTSYVLGSAGVRFGHFIVACCALLPALCMEVYFGYASKHLARVAGGRWHSTVHEVVVVAGIVVGVTVLVVISKTARRAIEAATHAPLTVGAVEA